MDADLNSFEGFDKSGTGYPKLLPDDCVEYTIYTFDYVLRTQQELQARLGFVLDESVKISETLLKDYIWQRESFKLELLNEKERTYLHGITHYSDSVEDEWLIVYILKELSRKFQDLWIQVIDTDGEFLLIEAANTLPRWLNPEIADNRVWINNNKLFIIPLAAAPSKSNLNPTVPISRPLRQEEALKIISSTPQTLINSPLIEGEAFYRLRKYPLQISRYLHHSVVRIPRKLAFILHRLPAAISPAVEAIYLRDPIALKALQGNPSKLVFPPTDLVRVSTRFTRLLFAQIKSQEFFPPFFWRNIMANAEQQEKESNQQFILGMKLTSGFEMLLNDTQYAKNPIVRNLRTLIEEISSDNQFGLPSDSEISQWKDVLRNDDESWLDINMQDFERELAGNNKYKSKQPHESPGQESSPGFGEVKSQADLKKMVERFESFMNDDKAGLEGAEIDDMDFDDDEYSDDEYSDGEDEYVSFDEEQFGRMMKEMMGMPSQEEVISVNSCISEESLKGVKKGQEVEANDETHEIQMVMQKIEAELNEAGVLRLGSKYTNVAAFKDSENLEAVNEEDHNVDSDNSAEEVNVDFNLAKNLLESFKGQAGLAGPAGNLLGLMGIQLPREEDF